MCKKVVAGLLLAVLCTSAVAQQPLALPRDVPPVVATAIVVAEKDKWWLKVAVPKVAWKVVGKRNPKKDWPKFEVSVEAAEIKLAMRYSPATALSTVAQNRVLDLKGKRLGRDEALKRLAKRTPVLVSVSGRMPDRFYLQCTKPDTLVVVLGIPAAPASYLLPQPARSGGLQKTGHRQSTKGWELYTWEERGETHHALMVGTNRLKSDEEIVKSSVRGLKAIQPQLDELKKGQLVFICGRARFEAAPQNARKALTEYCRKMGLKVGR